MILLGAIANSAAVLVGGAVGLFAGKLLSPRIQKAVTLFSPWSWACL